MPSRAKPTRVKWYRVPIDRDELAALNRRSDIRGLLQAGGYLGFLAVTGAAAYLSVGRLPWYAVIPLFYFHGACCNFLINGFHELVHDSVFKTKALNRIFLWLHSFFGWYNHVQFWASHTEHHKYTLHPPDDLEVVLPVQLNLKGFLLHKALISPMGFWWTLRMHLRLACGRLEGQWEHHLFDDDPANRARLFNWSRFVLVGHAVIIGLSLYFKLWLLPVVVSLAPFYGGALFYLLNNTQHVGLRDNVPDFRLCCRTIHINPFFRFLYWHMNYHIEHHMYAAVPCYNLRKLHHLIKDDLPSTPRGVVATWRQIAAILRRQKTEPTYQFTAEAPPMRARGNAADGQDELEAAVSGTSV